MCTYIYSQLKKNMCNPPPPLPPPPPPRGSMAPLMSQICTRLAEKISQNVLKVEA